MPCNSNASGVVSSKSATILKRFEHLIYRHNAMPQNLIKIPNKKITASSTTVVYTVVTSVDHKITRHTFLGNRLLNWPKLLRLYADSFYTIFVPECVPYIIPHMFQ